MSHIKSQIKRAIKNNGMIRISNYINPKNWSFLTWSLRKGNSFVNNGCRLQGVCVFARGSNNRVIIGRNATLRNCQIRIYGDNNTIEIGDSCSIVDGIFWLEDDGNVISIGRQTTVNGKTEFAAIEGTQILVGKDCMFSSNITLRTGDSHSIINSSGERINRSENIIVGDHVWVCAETMILKGSSISSNSIVGARSVVTKSFDSERVIIAGCPAQVIKSDISWDRKRI